MDGVHTRMCRGRSAGRCLRFLSSSCLRGPGSTLKDSSSPHCAAHLGYSRRDVWRGSDLSSTMRPRLTTTLSASEGERSHARLHLLSHLCSPRHPCFPALFDTSTHPSIHTHSLEHHTLTAHNCDPFPCLPCDRASCPSQIPTDRGYGAALAARVDAGSARSEPLAMGAVPCLEDGAPREGACQVLHGHVRAGGSAAATAGRWSGHCNCGYLR